MGLAQVTERRDVFVPIPPLSCLTEERPTDRRGTRVDCDPETRGKPVEVTWGGAGSRAERDEEVRTPGSDLTRRAKGLHFV